MTRIGTDEFFHDPRFIRVICGLSLFFRERVHVSSDGDFNVVQLASHTARISKNTMAYLESKDA